MKVLSQDEVTNVQGGAFVNNFSIPNLGLPNFRFDKFNPHLSGVGGGGKLNIPNFGNIRYGGGSIGANINVGKNINIVPSIDITKQPFKPPKITGGGVSVTVKY